MTSILIALVDNPHSLHIATLAALAAPGRLCDLMHRCGVWQAFQQISDKDALVMATVAFEPNQVLRDGGEFCHAFMPIVSLTRNSRSMT